MELNEALVEENERLRDHMESMIVLVQQFEAERAEMMQANAGKIDELERQIEFLQKEKEAAHLSSVRDKDETIKSL